MFMLVLFATMVVLYEMHRKTKKRLLICLMLIVIALLVCFSVHASLVGPLCDVNFLCLLYMLLGERLDVVQKAFTNGRSQLLL